jgi:hypothetical protein
MPALTNNLSEQIYKADKSSRNLYSRMTNWNSKDLLIKRTQARTYIMKPNNTRNRFHFIILC